MPAQFFNSKHRQCHDATTSRLRRLKTNTIICLLNACGNKELTSLEIKITPSQSSYFAPSQATQDAEQNRHKERSGACSLDQSNRALSVQNLHLPPLNLGRLHSVGRIAAEHLPLHRLRQRTLNQDVHMIDRPRRKPA